MRRNVYVALVIGALLAACTSQKISATLLASYDAGVSSEIAALSTGKLTPATATKLRACRVLANRAVQAVVKAEETGSAPPDVANKATTAVNAFVSAAAAATSSLSVNDNACTGTKSP